MTQTQRSDVRRHSARSSGAARLVGLRLGLDTMIFVLAIGFAIAVVFGWIA